MGKPLSLALHHPRKDGERERQLPSAVVRIGNWNLFLAVQKRPQIKGGQVPAISGTHWIHIP